MEREIIDAARGDRKFGRFCADAVLAGALWELSQRIPQARRQQWLDTAIRRIQAERDYF